MPAPASSRKGGRYEAVPLVAFLLLLAPAIAAPAGAYTWTYHHFKFIASSYTVIDPIEPYTSCATYRIVGTLNGLYTSCTTGTSG